MRNRWRTATRRIGTAVLPRYPAVNHGTPRYSAPRNPGISSSAMSTALCYLLTHIQRMPKRKAADNFVALKSAPKRGRARSASSPPPPPGRPAMQRASRSKQPRGKLSTTATSSAAASQAPLLQPEGHQTTTTAVVVAEVLKQLQEGGFLLKPLSTDMGLRPMDGATAADAERASANLGSNVAMDAVLASILQGEPQPLPDCTNFVSAAIPLGNHVSHKIKQKIWGGEYVEMSELCVEATEQKFSVVFSQQHDDNPSLAMTSQSKPKPIASFAQWQSAFNTYVAIYAERRASETTDLMKYAETIRELAHKFPGKAWQYYDQQFRYARQSNHMSWANLHMELYVKCISLHGVGQAPTLGNRRFEQARPATPLHQQSAFQNKVRFCYRFNSGRACDASACKYRHACMACQGTHPRVACAIQVLPRFGQSPVQPGQPRRAGPAPTGVPRT